MNRPPAPRRVAGGTPLSARNLRPIGHFHESFSWRSTLARRSLRPLLVAATVAAEKE